MALARGAPRRYTSPSPDSLSFSLRSWKKDEYQPFFFSTLQVDSLHSRCLSSQQQGFVCWCLVPFRHLHKGFFFFLFSELQPQRKPNIINNSYYRFITIIIYQKKKNWLPTKWVHTAFDIDKRPAFFFFSAWSFEKRKWSKNRMEVRSHTATIFVLFPFFSSRRCTAIVGFVRVLPRQRSRSNAFTEEANRRHRHLSGWPSDVLMSLFPTGHVSHRRVTWAAVGSTKHFFTSSLLGSNNSFASLFFLHLLTDTRG